MVIIIVIVVIFIVIFIVVVVVVVVVIVVAVFTFVAASRYTCPYVEVSTKLSRNLEEWRCSFMHSQPWY